MLAYCWINHNNSTMSDKSFYILDFWAFLPFVFSSSKLKRIWQSSKWVKPTLSEGRGGGDV